MAQWIKDLRLSLLWLWSLMLLCKFLAWELPHAVSQKKKKKKKNKEGRENIKSKSSEFFFVFSRKIILEFLSFLRTQIYYFSFNFS